MTAAEILTAVVELARDKLDLEVTLAPEMRLVEDLKLDSVQLMTLAMEVEDHFRVCLDEDDEQAIETVADLIGVVEKKLAD